MHCPVLTLLAALCSLHNLGITDQVGGFSCEENSFQMLHILCVFCCTVQYSTVKWCTIQHSRKHQCTLQSRSVSSTAQRRTLLLNCVVNVYWMELTDLQIMCPWFGRHMKKQHLACIIGWLKAFRLCSSFSFVEFHNFVPGHWKHNLVVSCDDIVHTLTSPWPVQVVTDTLTVSHSAASCPSLDTSHRGRLLLC